jgi:uncharacterized membrane protein YfcA
VATQLEDALLHGRAVRRFPASTICGKFSLFTLHYAVMALLCGLGFAGWSFLWFQKSAPFRLFPILAIFLVGDLLVRLRRNPQCDPALYYPKIPVWMKSQNPFPVGSWISLFTGVVGQHGGINRHPRL